MDTMQLLAMGAINRGKEKRIFDWGKAARLIKERRPQIALAVLEGDWFWTEGTIYENGAPVSPDDIILATTWATPVLVLDDEQIECWRMESEAPTWDSGTYWPQEALDILNEK